MKKLNINISYDEEKLSAIQLFLTQKDLNLDEELTRVLDTLFKKHVPSSVRDFIELKDIVAPLSSAKKSAKVGKDQANA